MLATKTGRLIEVFTYIDQQMISTWLHVTQVETEVSACEGISFLNPVNVIHYHQGHKCKQNGKRSL